MKKTTLAFLAAAMAMLMTAPAYAQRGDSGRDGRPSGRSFEPSRGSRPSGDSHVGRTVSPSYTSGSVGVAHGGGVRPYGGIDYRHHYWSGDRFTFSWGFVFPLYYPRYTYYEPYPYYPRYYYYPYDYGTVYTTRYVYTQPAQPGYEELGGMWAAGLRRGDYSWDMFINYVKAYIVSAPVDSRDRFRHGFIVAYGADGITAYDNAYQHALQPAAPDFTAPPPPPPNQ